jgi:hypothetical protein
MLAAAVVYSASCCCCCCCAHSIDERYGRESRRRLMRLLCAGRGGGETAQRRAPRDSIDFVFSLFTRKSWSSSSASDLAVSLGLAALGRVIIIAVLASSSTSKHLFPSAKTLRHSRLFQFAPVASVCVHTSLPSASDYLSVWSPHHHDSKTFPKTHQKIKT